MSNASSYVRVEGKMDEIEPRITKRLADEGFGVLSRIPFHEILQEKIGAEIEPYVRLGVCNPSLAYKVLKADLAVGILLPCAVYLRKVGDEVEVGFLRPEPAFSLVTDAAPDELAELGHKVEESLLSAIRSLEAPL